MNISCTKFVLATCCVALLSLSGCTGWRQGDTSTKVTETTKVKKEDGGTVVEKTRKQKTYREDKATSRMQGNAY